MYSFLYIAYHFISLFYLASGVILLVTPTTIERYIPMWFPYMHALRWRRLWSGINLIVVGVVLLFVGRWIVEGKIIGLLMALSFLRRREGISILRIDFFDGGTIS